MALLVGLLNFSILPRERDVLLEGHMASIITSLVPLRATVNPAEGTYFELPGAAICAPVLFEARPGLNLSLFLLHSILYFAL